VAGFAFYSGALFHTAHRAAASSQATRDQSLIAVVFAAAALEGFVNECFDYLLELNKDPAFDRMRAIAAAADVTSRATSLSTKIQLLSAGIAGRNFDRGRQPYQDFDLLIALRNGLLHQRMERLPGDDAPDVQPNRLVERARSRGLIEPESAGVTSVMGVASAPKVAMWAVSTSLEMAKQVSDLFPPHAQTILSTTIVRLQTEIAGNLADVGD
jgi:hypothetical protein